MVRRRVRDGLMLLAACLTAVILAVPAAAGGSASSTIADLEAQGYNVQINWTTGYDTKPLSECWVTAVNDPSHGEAIEGTFTTVYVDVACPNGDDGGSFGGGIGIG